jgi:hypothetical protein
MSVAEQILVVLFPLSLLPIEVMVEVLGEVKLRAHLQG